MSYGTVDKSRNSKLIIQQTKNRGLENSSNAYVAMTAAETVCNNENGCMNEILWTKHDKQGMRR